MRSGRKAPAFTLIELLVVVAIIAMLMAILLPSLAAVKTRARRAAGLANLQQIGLGLQQYTQDDHRNQLVPLTPVMVRIDEGIYKRTAMWFTWGGSSAVEPLYRENGTEVWISEQSPNPYYGTAQRTLTTYLYPNIADGPQDLAVFHCPADTGYPEMAAGLVDEMPVANAYRPLYDILGNSYRANLAHLWAGSFGGINRFSYGIWGQKLDALEKTSEIVWGGDPLFFTMLGSKTDSGLAETQCYGWHGEYMSDNMVFADGSARLTCVAGVGQADTMPDEADLEMYGVDLGLQHLLVRSKGWQVDCFPRPGVAFGRFVVTQFNSWPYASYRKTPPPDEEWE